MNDKKQDAYKENGVQLCTDMHRRSIRREWNKLLQVVSFGCGITGSDIFSFCFPSVFCLVSMCCSYSKRENENYKKFLEPTKIKSCSEDPQLSIQLLLVKFTSSWR